MNTFLSIRDHRYWGSDSNSSNTPTATNLPKGLDSGRTSPDIEVLDKGKSKLFTSPSLEDLNSKAKESWEESSGSSSTSSPDSTSSSETITPYNFTSIDSTILAKVNTDWKDLTPTLTHRNINFIESHINNFEYKDQMIKYLSEIEKEKGRLIERIERLKIEFLKLK